MSLINIFVVKLNSLFQKPQSIGSTDFPKELYGYSYDKTMEQKETYAIAKYTNADSKSVIAKIWSSNKPDLFYLTILNEINIYKFLATIKSPKVITPKLIGCELADNKVLFVTEFLDEITNSTELDIDNYFKVIEFLDDLSKNNTLVNIQSRSASSYLALILPIYASAVLNDPKQFNILTKGLFTFLKNIGYLLKLDYKKAVHKDLNHTNFASNNNQIRLIDFQYLTRTAREMDYAATYRFYVSQTACATKFVETLKNRLDNNSYMGFVVLSIFYAIMGLTGKNISETRRKDFIQVLENFNA